MKPKRIILASKSPRRKDLLEMAGFCPVVRESHCDEGKIKENNPRKLVEALSEAKAAAVEKDCSSGDMIIAADTVVCLNKKIFGKPKTKKEACEMIHELQGKEHQVYTGVTLIYKGKKESIRETFSEKTTVAVRPMTNCEIRSYVKTGEPMDKAGGYGIQGPFGKYIPQIKGDIYTVIGLPLSETCKRIKDMRM